MRKKNSKPAGASPAERLAMLNAKVSFAKDNVHSDDSLVQKQVIDTLRGIWHFRNPPKEAEDDVLWAKIALMSIVGADDSYPNFSSSMKHYAVNAIWDCVSEYAKKCIHEYAKSYVNTGCLEMNADNVNGMISEEWIATATYIHTYDPERAAPLTFLKQCFIHGIFEWKKKKMSIGANSSVTGLTKRVTTVKNRLEAENKEVTLQSLHEELPGVSLDAIQTALITLEASQNMASLEACAELMESRASTIKSPEEVMMRAEEDERLYNAIKRLPKEELAAYCLNHGIDITDCSVSLTPQPAGKIAKLMNTTSGHVTFLLARADQDLYTFMTGHRRNERYSPNHRPDNIVRSSCDEIHFFGDSRTADAELEMFSNITDEVPAMPLPASAGVPDGIFED